MSGPGSSSSPGETTGGTTGGPAEPIESWPVLRGALHVHSPFSHDACDGEGLSDTGYDFTLLTDHPSFMQGYTFNELLLEQPGDVLEMEGGAPIANHIVCGDGHEAVVAVGYESTHVMPLGLHRHVEDEFYAGMTDANSLPESMELIRHAPGRGGSGEHRLLRGR